MKVTAPAAALANALALSMPVARSNKTIPALVHIVTDNGAASFTCSGLDTAIKITVAADVEEAGEITVVADRLAGLVSGNSITINTTTDGAMVSSGGGRYRLAALDVPAALKLNSEIARVEIDGRDLLFLLKVLPAAETDQTRFYLNGFFMHNVGSELIAVATDGKKLLRTSVRAGHFSTDRRFIVPTKGGTILTRLIMTMKPERVVLRRSASRFAVAAPDFELTTALIDYEYPGYEHLVPPTSTNVALCSRYELIGALTRLGAVAGEMPLVALTWMDGEPLRLFLPRQPGDAEDAIAAQASGRARIVLMLPQIMTMIANISCDHIHLEVASEVSPLVLRGEQGKFGMLTRCGWNWS
jgi:DNA polymerase-3 subunit beta